MFGRNMVVVWYVFGNCLFFCLVYGKIQKKDKKMGLMEDIKEVEQEQKKGKKVSEILSVKDEIFMMIEKNISLRKQIKLLRKNKIIEDINLTYYRDILIKYFDYKKTTPKKDIVTPTTTVTQTKTIIKSKPTQQKIVDILSADVDLDF